MQISFFLFSPLNISQNFEKSQTFDELHLFEKVSKTEWKKNKQFSEKQVGKRQIKSLRSDDYGAAKKVRFQPQHMKKGKCCLLQSVIFEIFAIVILFF